MSDKILGAHGANEEVLDQVQAAIAGEPLPHASLLPYEIPDAYEPQDCKACNGHGMVGGLRSDGYDGEICPACGGTCEQPDTVKVPRELADRLCHRDNYTRQMARRELRNILLGKEGEA